MKPKYYPHITIAAAGALIIAPLCLVLSLPHLHSLNDEDILWTEHDIEDPALPDAVDTLVATNPSSSATAAPSVTPTDSFDSVSTAPERNVVREETTRIALRNPAHRAFADVPEVQPADRPPTPAPQLDIAAIREMATAQAIVQSVTQDATVPVPVIAPPSVTTTTVPESVTHATKPESSVSSTPANTPVETADSEFVIPIVRPPSMFEATGHLSLAGGTTGAMSGTPSPVVIATEEPASKKDADAQPGTERIKKKTPEVASAVDIATATDAQTTDQPRVPRWKLMRQQEAEAREKASAAMRPEAPASVEFAPGFGTKPPVQLEDVILQHPLENRRVSRMENLVAVTRAPGWPIALVRSDLPDDHWWVQQMVGIRGNAFAARVNFGNADSITGSVYHMVIVFLDSPDEVRRFQIAKQFKDLPEGIRRTREYTFVRR